MEKATRIAEISVICVTDTEAKVALQVFTKNFTKKPRMSFKRDTTVWDFGVVRDFSLSLVLAGFGDEGPGAVSLSLSDYLSDAKPTYVIMGGICFGLRSDKDKLCDVIVSQAVRAYNLRRQTVDDKGQSKTVLRGDRASSDPTLYNRFRTGIVTSPFSFGVKPELYVSGGALADDPNFVASLLDMEPEARAGEMEGAGLYSACARNSTPWILVKAICDWGMNKGNKEQEQAATNSFEFIAFVLRQGGFS